MEGYYTGSFNTICSLLNEGLISREVSELFLAQIQKGDTALPQKAIDAAFAAGRADPDFKDCPLPVKR